MKLKFLLILVLVSINFIYPQRLLKLSISIDGQTERISYLSRKGTDFVSAKELATVLSGNFYYNKESAKLELKFDNYKIKVTGRTQYLILINRADNSQQIYQFPISTLLVRGDVLIPLIYCVDYISLAYGKELLYDKSSKHLTVSDKAVKDIAVTDDTPGSIIKKPRVTREVDPDFDVYDLRIEEKSNGTLIRLNSQREINKFSSSIQNNKLFIFLSGVSVDLNKIRKAKPKGLVRKVSTQSVQGNIQFEFLLKEGFNTSEAFQDVSSNDLLVAIHNEKLKTDEPVISDEIKKWLFDVIVIDPGHGGKDSGALGVGGTKEKDLNLRVGLKLGELIEKRLPDVKVVYTRKTDKFIELYKRGKIANENNGKLFVSIHMNSLPKKPSSAKGFEVYLLRPGRTQKAIEIAEFENSVIKYEDNPDMYQKLDDENFILVSMAHSQYMRYSEKFSDLLNENWKKTVKGIPSRGVKQAGFYVLVGASMPNVLVECGFLSNRQDEAFLKSAKGQSQIAETIYKTIVQYKNFYEDQINENIESAN
ncbi:MAG: N-acetylmuramoyl-L-alanine amidase [Ignavibacteria bacterium]|jgi:N-acetylmuramoyl-L-alanine amidase